MNDTDHLGVPAGFDQVLEAAAPLGEVFRRAGHRMYLVGGVVRDHWIGVDRHDYDLDATTDARPPRIKQLVADLADAVWTQGERYGTIGCTIAGRTYEITTHRSEVYPADSRKPEVAFGDDVVDDLARRDFTVNAMAVDLADRVLVDPFDGRGDLERGVLRTPLEPEIAFSEDPLRMLRAARFHAAYALEPTRELTLAVGRMGERISIVSAERVRDELEKLLLLADPAPGLRFLEYTGLLERVIPELADLDEVGFERMSRRVTAVVAEPSARWAALLLDLDEPAGRLRALRSSGSRLAEVASLVAAATWLDDADLPSGPPAVRRAASGLTSVSIDDVVRLVRALRGADGTDVAPVDRLAAEVAELRVADPDLDDPPSLLRGTDVIRILQVGEGRDVGRAMRFLAELRIEEGPLDAATATERLTAWWAQEGAGTADA